MPNCSPEAEKKRVEANELKKKNKPSTPKALSTSAQPKINLAFKALEKWKNDDPRSIEIDLKILQWMCLNCKPLNEVENEGFPQLISSLNSQ